MRLLVSNGVKAALVAVQPACEAQTGTTFVAEFGTSNGLRAMAAKGQAFDIAVMTEDAIDALVAEKKLDAASKTMVAKTRIGVGVRQNAAAPDVRTADAVRKALLGASSVTWASDGASRPFIEKMVEKLGITAQMAAKTNPEQGSPRATARVVNGQSDIVLTLISEIVPVQGLKMVGALPAEFQGEVSFAAGVAGGQFACLDGAPGNRVPGGPERRLVVFVSGTGPSREVIRPAADAAFRRSKSPPGLSAPAGWAVSASARRAASCPCRLR